MERLPPLPQHVLERKESMSTSGVGLDQGIHVMHLFHRVDRRVWRECPDGERFLEEAQAHIARFGAPSHPRIVPFVNVGGKADLAFMLHAADLVTLGEMHRQLEACFPPGLLQTVYSYLSVTELPEYVTTEEDLRQMILGQEKLAEGSEAFRSRLDELRRKQEEYRRYRLYPELPDWEVMGFYPMSKRRLGNDNWYSLDAARRKELMKGHARVGRRYAGRISQLITGSTGLDDWEWGVTLMAHRVDALKEIVHEMRFDEVSARYGEFGPFYVNLRMDLGDAWKHLALRGGSRDA